MERDIFFKEDLARILLINSQKDDIRSKLGDELHIP